MILVTGGMGFLGVHTARSLLDAGHDVVLTRHRSLSEPPFLIDEIGSRVHVVSADVADPVSMRWLFDEHSIDGVVHLAVPPRNGLSPAEEITNASGMFLPTIAAAIRAGVPRVVMASSLAVYLGNDAEVWSEDDPIDLRSLHPIAAIKRSEEALASYLAATTDTSIVRARITSIWGPLYRTMLNVPSRLALLASGRDAQVAAIADPRLAHPDDELELMHVTDCARALTVLLDSRDSGDVFNVSSGSLVRYGDLVDAANDAGAKEPIELQIPERAPAKAARLATDRLAALGFRPRVGVSDGMADYVGWLREHDV